MHSILLQARSFICRLVERGRGGRNADLAQKYDRTREHGAFGEVSNPYITAIGVDFDRSPYHPRQRRSAVGLDEGGKIHIADVERHEESIGDCSYG